MLKLSVHNSNSFSHARFVALRRCCCVVLLVLRKSMYLNKSQNLLLLCTILVGLARLDKRTRDNHVQVTARAMTVATLAIPTPVIDGPRGTTVTGGSGFLVDEPALIFTVCLPLSTYSEGGRARCDSSGQSGDSRGPCFCPH